MEDVDGVGSKEKIVYVAVDNRKHIGVIRVFGEANCYLDGRVDRGEVNCYLDRVMGKAGGNPTKDEDITRNEGRGSWMRPVAITDQAIPACKSDGDAETTHSLASGSKANEEDPVDPQLYKNYIGSK